MIYDALQEYVVRPLNFEEVVLPKMAPVETYPLDGNEKKMYELVFREKVSPGEVMPNAQAK